MIKILQKDNKVLRMTAKDVLVGDITSDKVQKIIHNMQEALDSQDDGVAIAAPQIGESLRIFVVSKKVFEMDNLSSKQVTSKTPKHDTMKDEQPKSNKTKKLENLIFINPKIVKFSKKKLWMDEGCLSVRWFYGQTKRAQNATVDAYNEHGKKFTRGAGGLLAQIFQHEIDHLNGMLFTDHAKEIEEVLPVSN